jgi:uncharacterized protein
MLVLSVMTLEINIFYKSMNNTDIIDRTISFVKEKLKHAEGGHDWFHIERVYKNALLIAKGSL